VTGDRPTQDPATAAARLSIVVPVLDEAVNLQRLLPDLAARFGEAEVIVVDGGSADASAAVARAAPGVRCVPSPAGRARQMNAGAAAASGDVLLFLHADTVLPDGAVAAIVGALRDPAVVGGRFDVRFSSPRWPLRMVAALMNRRSRLTSIATGDQAIFVRRPIFETLGGYPPIPLMEDIELTKRLKRQGPVAALRLRVTTSSRKWEREGIARTITLMWILRFLYWCGMDPAKLHRWYYGRPAPR
jgi:rSAM/selenodomain-associated transferase 2